MLKQSISHMLLGSRLHAPVRHVYRRFSPRRLSCTRNEVAFYSRFVSPGDLVFDIGGNLGYKTEVFLACGARVVCVEPNPGCHPVLDFEFAGDSRVSLVKKAVGSSEATLPMSVSGTATTSTLLDDWAPLSATEGEVQKIEVAVTTLDNLIAEFGTPQFIKIDIEGFELPALQGLTQKVPCLSFEYSLLREGPDRLMACLHQLERLGTFGVNAILDPPDDTRNLAFAWPKAVPLQALDLSAMPRGGDCFVDFRPATAGQA